MTVIEDVGDFGVGVRDEEIVPLVPQAAQVTGSESTATSDGAVYDRFSESQKRIIFAVVLWSSLLPSGAFASGYLSIAEDLKVDVTVLNYILGSYGFSPQVLNQVSTNTPTFLLDGRRFVFLLSLPLVCAGCLIAALSVSAGQLAFARILQAIGVSSTYSTGIAVISDIYRRENRGTAIGFLNGVSEKALKHVVSFVYLRNSLIKNPILVVAPFLSGIVTSYFPWRAMHIVLVFMSFLSVILVVLYLPETSHPGTIGVCKDPILRRKGGLRLLNPFKSLKLLKIPGILFWALSITSMVDSLVATFSRKLQGGSLILVPPSILLSGLTLDYVPGSLGLGINLFGVVQSPTYAYILDILRERSAETRAISGAMDSLFSSIVSATVLPSINIIGFVWTFALLAGAGWIGSL
ncbi:hypothetical protein Clacol_000107 [Clathrus columnatus]|uniref:Major facilitator superfamily (MFS) profile domain-containing protein n=1 Tax=Clathrus columnatus TaxID=1419009 RepID=A0AAV5A1Z8_9AGAM|nr:hypothetical protein Clacol_000107 [Clathrus columnatus]